MSQKALLLLTQCPGGEIGRRTILRGWRLMGVAVRICSWAHQKKDFPQGESFLLLRACALKPDLQFICCCGNLRDV